MDSPTPTPARSAPSANRSLEERHTSEASDFTFNLTAARWSLRVFAGIGGAVAVILVMVAGLSVIPGARQHQVGPLELVLTLGVIGLVAVGCAKLAAGPPLRLTCRAARLSLVHARKGETLAEASLDEARVEPVTVRTNTLRFAALEISLPDRRPLVVATLDTQLRFRKVPERGDPTHTLPREEFARVVDRLCPQAWAHDRDQPGT